MIRMLPLTKEQLAQILGKLNISDITNATIRQVCAVAAVGEEMSGEKFVHLEVGNPGIPANHYGIKAECEALQSGVANQYPPIQGIPALKNAASRFLKAFLDVDLDGKYIVPTVGSMQGCFTTMLLLGQRDPLKDTMLFIDPGFPAQHTQAKILGLKSVSFDLYNYRGDKLEAKLEELLSPGNVTGIIYSNPNNPAWTNLTEQELEVLGRMATKYDAIIIEDLAYLGMDFRSDFGVPYAAPYVPTVSKYTDNYILSVSASKIFSYAGQRIALVCMSEQVFNRHYPFLASFYEMPAYGDAYIYGVLYAASSGTSHSAQCALAAMMDAAADGKLNFVEDCKEYERRGGRAKKIFTDNGFHIVYSMDGSEPISDGFFFTVGYGDMTSEELQNEMMRYGVAAISLPGTGSKQNGLRVTISLLNTDADFEALDSRLKAFNNDHR